MRKIKLAVSTSRFKSERELLAFVHIEKAAGTTLNHILRTNFFMRYCDVKPFSRTSRRIFRAEDLRKTMAINPAIKCISGHAIKPFVDLGDRAPMIRYITLLRDPLQRYISQYQYWVEELGKKLTFEEFLSLKNTINFQTKKIAGAEDFQLAKDIVSNRFFLVGIVEEFDQFLILLKKEIGTLQFQAGVSILQNVGNRKSSIRVGITQKMSKYQDKIMEANQLDMELYRYVRDELIPKEKEQFGPDFEDAVKAFKKAKKKYPKMPLRYADYVLRKCYYEPIFGLIRRLNGLPAKGSY